ncbi:hypothetical protein BDQ17DRAFT_1342614 [Cyathus striatus]|nr:hypothetical protein BDQ17DRAFT_1342614 [Cyathus striatus]
MLVKFTGVKTTASWKQFFIAMNKHCDHRKLMELVCRDGLNRGPTIITTNSDEMVDYEALKPLLVFHKLAWLDIKATKGFHFSDPSTMIQEMATTWKNVQELNLSMLPFSPAGAPSKITFLGLIPFAKHCPKLEVLGLSFNATSPPVVDKKKFPWNEFYNTKLRELHVWNSPIKKPTLVAAALSGIFPSLETFKTIEGAEAEAQDRQEIMEASNRGWSKAEELLKVFSAVREQERSYANRCKAVQP